MSKKILAVAAAAGSLGLSLAAHADTQVTENTSVGGRTFIDFTNLDASTYAAGVGTKSAASGYGIDVSRFYLILDHTFDSTWSANLTTDFNYSSPTSETQVFIKKAYVQAKFSDALFVRAGSADMPWIPYVEGNYGYRFVEKMVVDRLGYGNTADWGLHAGGKFSDGMFGYAVSTVEGRGYKNPTRSKSLDWEGRINASPVKGLALAAGFYSGKRGNDIDGPTAPTSLHTTSRLDLFAGYSIAAFKIGAEYFSADYWNTITSATAKDKADGFSVFASYQFTPTVAGFARYDDTTTNGNKNVVTPDGKDTYYNAGVAFKPRKGVDVAVAYKHDEKKLGGAKTADSDEIGAWAQVSF
jgi:hypothetical protein